MKLSHGLNILAGICLTFLFVGCGEKEKDSFPIHAGDTYEVVGNLCIVGDLLKDEDVTDLAGWQDWCTKFNKKFEKLPLGTKIKIIGTQKETRSSWNTGRYSYHLVYVNILSDAHKDVRYDASHLLYGHNGEKLGTGGRLPDTLKVVTDTSKK